MIRWKRSVEDDREVWSLDLGLRILGVKEVSCKRRLVRLKLDTSSIEHINKKKNIKCASKVCDLHSLMLSCPIWLRAPMRLITSRLSINPYR